LTCKMPKCSEHFDTLDAALFHIKYIHHVDAPMVGPHLIDRRLRFIEDYIGTFLDCFFPDLDWLPHLSGAKFGDAMPMRANGPRERLILWSCRNSRITKSTITTSTTSTTTTITITSTTAA